MPEIEDFDCLVSVGICTYNQKKLCRNLVEGLLKHGPEDIRIFIWDNKPDDPGFLGELKNDSRVEVIEDETNSGYIIPNNRMATACKSKYHIVANDDVILGPNWFEPLIKEFEDPLMACVGPTGLFGVLDNGFSGQRPKPNQKQEYVEGWWMVFPRHIIARYGWVFDEENLRLATSEDSHTSLLLREHGWKIKILDDLPIKHLESVTKKSLDIQNWCDENKGWLKKRWKYYLKNREFPEHKILVKGANISKKQLKEIRWKYPHSHITFQLDKNHIDDVVWDSDGDYSMEI
jgi:GT2 family glycosyltransferase